MFSEENYVPQTANWVDKRNSALYCVIMIQAEIHQLFKGRACTNTILFKIQSAVVTLNMRSRSLKSNSFLSANNVSMQVWCRKTHWFRTELRKAYFTVFFKDEDHDNEVTLKTRSKSPNYINSLFCPNDTLHKSLARIHCSIQEISYKSIILVKIWHFKVLVWPWK